MLTPHPQQGDVVSFSFQKITKYTIYPVVMEDWRYCYRFKEPIDPTITRIRTDVKWEDVLQSHEEDGQAMRGKTWSSVGLYLLYT